MGRKLQQLISSVRQFETLRLYNPIPGVPKYTGQHATTLEINGRTHVISADTLVQPSLQAMHTHPRHWGPDSLSWRPQRWISSGSAGRGLEAEMLVVPQRGTYFPWSEGAQNCPGKRFAQVEFVAVLAALFRNHVAEPVPRPGESDQAARQRTLREVEDSSVRLLLQMRHPDSVAVRWRERT